MSDRQTDRLGVIGIEYAFLNYVLLIGNGITVVRRSRALSWQRVICVLRQSGEPTLKLLCWT